MTTAFERWRRDGQWGFGGRTESLQPGAGGVGVLLNGGTLTTAGTIAGAVRSARRCGRRRTRIGQRGVSGASKSR